MATKYQISQDDPLAVKLLEIIPIKANELGWFTEDSSLSEYVVMKFATPKTQDELASELEEELLQPEDRGAPEFAEWIFARIAELRGEAAGSAQGQENSQMQDSGVVGGEAANNGGGDMEMDEGPSDGSIPTGPKSMRNSTRGKRNMLGQISKHLERPSDSVLHRVRAQKGNERIGAHGKDPPKGPRNFQNKMPRGPNGRANMPMMPGMGNAQGAMGSGMAGPAGMNMNMTQQQQMQLMAMYEQQARMMAQILSPQQQQQIFTNPGAQSQMPGGPFIQNPSQQQSQPRSLFERMERPRNGSRGPTRGGWNGAKGTHGTSPDGQDAMSTNADPPSSMEVEASQSTTEGSTAGQTCRFNLTCTNKDCKYAHQSPAAPPGTPIDINDQCNFGAACKNKKCVANHPSPAQKSIHQADQDCKFFPNCTNPACPFKHPAMPLCRNGADCAREGCKFTHLTQKCKYSPCMNRVCPYKHEEGQRGAYADKVWVSGEEDPTEHISDRKFVDDQGQEEELILPGSDGPMSTSGAELVT